MNSRITGVEEADVLLLVGTNPKHESPVLNSRILKAVRDNNLKVFTIGSPCENTYKTVHLGSSTKVLEEIASGKHPFFDRLNKAKLPMVILGTGAVQRADGASLVECVKQISQKTPIINAQAGWNGFNILH
jgi:NADH dehydrogenase (ubiquinone) Fe-S protein 1